MPRIIKSAKGTFTTSTVTIDSSGRVVAAATGSAGGANLIPTKLVTTASPGTFTATNNANFGVAYLYSGGGGGGAGGNHPGNLAGPGVEGAVGAMGVFGFPISGGESHNFNIGAAGNAGSPGGTGNPGGAGGAGGATTFTNIGTANGGGGGAGGPNTGQNAPNATASAGSAPGATLASTTAAEKKIFSGGVEYGAFGDHGNRPGNAGSAGAAGAMMIYENIGE